MPVSKLCTLVIQFLLPVLILASAAVSVPEARIIIDFRAMPAAPPSTPTAASAENLEASGPNPLGRPQNNIRHESRQVVLSTLHHQALREG